VVNIAGHAVDVDARRFGGLIAEPATGLARKSQDDYSDQVILLGRLKPGTTRESLRVVHVFALAPDLLHSPVVTARCGEPLPANDMQWLPGLTGMPCEQCVMAD
jgi:hypothetical protein